MSLKNHVVLRENRYQWAISLLRDRRKSNNNNSKLEDKQQTTFNGFLKF